MPETDPPILNGRDPRSDSKTTSSTHFNAATDSQSPYARHTAEESEGTESILASRWAILGLLFLVTAARGLPFLWMSPSFSRSEKWVWSWIVIVYTIVLVGLTTAIVWWSYSSIANLLG